MVEFEPLRHWKWTGNFLGLRVEYDHVFIETEPQLTTIRIVVDAEGWSLPLIGPVFGRIYKGNLDRAVPLLVREIEHGTKSR
jgi:hypothetical protein